MPESEALARSTAAVEHLTEEVHQLSVKLDTEREERHDEQQRMRDNARLALGALVLAIAVLAGTVGLLAYTATDRDRTARREVERRAAALVEDEHDRCEQTNRARQGNRAALTVLIDRLFLAAAENAAGNPHTPNTSDRIEALRQQVLDDVMAELDESQPIVNCAD